MANLSIYAAFERMWQHVIAALGGKADSEHTHDEYATEESVDTKISNVNTSITNIVDGTTTVAKATSADSATSADTADSANTATSATKATQDGSGNVITTTYETVTNAQTKYDEIDTQIDEKIAFDDFPTPDDIDTICGGTIVAASEESY